jgi:hypothetical protein
MMKKFVMALASIVLVAGVGCDDKKTKEVKVDAGPVKVDVNKDEVKVDTPNNSVEVDKTK